MGKNIHLLAFTAFLIGVIFADAVYGTSIVSHVEVHSSEESSSSSEEDYEYHDDYYCDSTPPHKCNKPNEYYDECPPSCPKRVCGIDDRLVKCCPQPKPGDKDCNKPACRCKHGYYRDSKGNCVLWKDCPPPPLKCTKPNEYYDECPPKCPKRVCGVDDRMVKCSPQPKPGDKNCDKPACRCKPGYYRDSKGNCVPWKDCPVCPKNEKYDPCDAPCPARTCSFDPRVAKCGPPPKLGDPSCLVGCRCIDGYLRNDKGVCIPKEECKCTCQEKKCKKPNEVYDECPATCPPRVCGIDDRLIDCKPQPRPGDKDCNKPACRCKDGYYRDNKGNCVLWKNCPKCPKNEQYDPCDSPCPERTCSFDPRVVRCAAPPKLGDPACVVGCRCIDGYLRNDKGVCIPQEQCNTCKKNEKLEKCPDTYCLIKACTDLGFPIKCKEPLADGSCPGKPGCICAPGYARDSKGKCIKVDDCPSCGGDKNAKLGCGTNCGKKCSDVGKKGPFRCPLGCRYNGCDCRDGFYYDENKKRCVKPNECSICKENEKYVDCVDTYCLIKDCKDLGFPIKCKDKPKDGSCPGKPGCVCVPGYARNNQGRCIKTDQCPSCGGDKNAKPGCGINCGKKCTDVGKKGPFKCPPGCRYNGCDCKEGYYYDAKKKKCVLPKDCPSNCKENETFVECPDAACKPKTCKEVGFPVKCPKYTKCPSPPGCICVSAYVRNDRGICVPPTECPSCGGDKNAKVGCGTNCGKKCSDLGKKGPFQCPIGCSLYGCDCKDGFYYDEKKKKCVLPRDCPRPSCKNNEIFVDCPEAECNPKTCKEVGFPVACPSFTSCPSPPGCVCAAGYVGNERGNCIPATDCPSCGGDENAKVGCGTNCGKKCSDLGKTGPFQCPIGCSLYGCDCKDGFYYDEDKKKCVLPRDCPRQPCKENEVFVDCPEGACYPKTCKEVGFPVPCPDYPTCPSPPGCICAGGYVRNERGVCISASDCPSCGGDENAKVGCGTNCGKKCSDLGKTGPFQCPIGCSLYGCDCKDGFYYDENKKKCVLPRDCPKSHKCGPDEVLVECPQTKCNVQRCDQLGFEVACPAIACSGEFGCICKEGYLRDCDDVCIPQDHCPSCGGDENAKPGCGVNCGKKCSDVGKKGPVACPLICKLNACDCKDGFYYDEKKKKCVHPSKCSSKC